MPFKKVGCKKEYQEFKEQQLLFKILNKILKLLKLK